MVLIAIASFFNFPTIISLCQCAVWGRVCWGLTDRSQHSAPVIDNQYFYVYFFRCRLSIRNFSFFPNCFLIFSTKKNKKISPRQGGLAFGQGGLSPPTSPPAGYVPDTQQLL